MHLLFDAQGEVPSTGSHSLTSSHVYPEPVYPLGHESQAYPATILVQFTPGKQGFGLHVSLPIIMNWWYVRNSKEN